MSDTPAEFDFDSHFSKDDPEYATKRKVWDEIKELSAKYRAEEGLRGLKLRRRVREEMNKRYAGNGRILQIIQIILSILSIVLFFI